MDKNLIESNEFKVAILNLLESADLLTWIEDINNMIAVILTSDYEKEVVSNAGITAATLQTFFIELAKIKN